MMILVNNNMVRAFAIGAAIALVRFRIKLDGKSANASLLFAILAGIACGLSELSLAWTLLATYVLLVGIVAVVTRVMIRHDDEKAPEGPEEDADPIDTLVMRSEEMRVFSPPNPSSRP
jgi:hypothetical protein